jgi:hypothetical protein
MLNLKSYSINSNITLTNEILESYITNFWNDIFNSIRGNSHLLIMCRIQFNDESGSYRTLGHLRRVNYSDKTLFIEYLTSRLGILTESYTTHPISKLTFTYVIKEGLTTDNRTLLQDLSNKSNNNHRFNNKVLPISMNPSDYGDIIVDNYIQLSGELIHRFKVRNEKKIFTIDISNDGLTNHVTIEGAIDLSWIDTKISGDVFKREIGKSIIVFMDGEIVLRKINRVAVDKSLVITMDIETIKLQGKLNPYLICAYDGLNYITSYANESLNQKALFNNFINQLLTFFNKDSNKIIVYAHNFSGFDGIFLLRHLLSFGKVKPVLFKGKLMSIKVKLNIKGYKGKTIIFKDSYLLLPFSLRKLCLAFNVTIPKGYFPFNLTNILYKGLFPKFEYWTGISLTEYESLTKEYLGKVWNFQLEATKYCKLDCKCLHEIIVKFNELIFKQFNINIHVPLTLPSLAMRIYKSQFMPENTIYQIGGRIDSDIRQSYTGGAEDVYIPHNRITGFFNRTVKALFKLLYYYDVNSLYPFIMSETPMPVGKPMVFTGNIRQFYPEAFGFFYCKITSPAYLEHPILQRRIKTAEGLRTIAGLGSWSGWIYSPEMDNAMKFGYTFEILNGYQFEKGYIFKEYINKMYELRMQYEKGHPINIIAKLLMISLYGKFGMKVERTTVDIFNLNNDADKLALRELLDTVGESIQDFIQIDDYYLIVRDSLVNLKYNEGEDYYHGVDVNVAIASAITAGARVYMSAFKNNPLFKLYYSDTDSFVIDKPLPEHMVGTELGQVKLEHTIKKAIFLAPKVYGLIDVNGEEIIKVKGFTPEAAKELSVTNLEHLLVKDSTKEITQEKWYKKVIEGEISISDVIYTLKVTSNKRDPIYINDEGIEIYNSTKPVNYDVVKSKSS